MKPRTVQITITRHDGVVAVMVTRRIAAVDAGAAERLAQAMVAYADGLRRLNPATQPRPVPARPWWEQGSSTSNT